MYLLDTKYLGFQINDHIRYRVVNKYKVSTKIIQEKRLFTKSIKNNKTIDPYIKVRYNKLKVTS